MESFVAASSSQWKVIGLPAFQDNYLWLIVNTQNNHCAVVDPGCATTVEAYVQSHGLHLSAIFLTHHHPDHIGGVSKLLSASSNQAIKVYGTASGRIPQVSHALEESSQIQWEGLSFRVMEVPGHTIDHLSYFCQTSDINWLFCGDTLFVGGCGRLFEGTHAQMHASLKRFAALPPNTFIFCAHEYTLSNYRFLSQYEPNNLPVLERLSEVEAHRKNGLPTVPSTIEKELKSNLFLTAQSVDAFKAIRTAKDSF